MKTAQISSHAWQLTQWGAINAFLVREDDGFTLIDTCLNQASQIAQGASHLGAPIRRIVLTHAHGDHAGSVDGLLGGVSGAEFLLSGREARLLAGDRRLDPGEPDTPLRGNYAKLDAKPSRLLTAGERIGSLEVISAPGHTPGHIALLDVRDRTLFAGDAWSVLGGLAIAGHLRILFPLPAMATWNFPLAVQSARGLIEQRPELLAVGHGRSLVSPLSAMEKELGECEQRLGVTARKPSGGST